MTHILGQNGHRVSERRGCGGEQPSFYGGQELTGGNPIQMALGVLWPTLPALREIPGAFQTLQLPT